jgi:hypothetical protein
MQRLQISSYFPFPGGTGCITSRYNPFNKNENLLIPIKLWLVWNLQEKHKIMFFKWMSKQIIFHFEGRGEMDDAYSNFHFSASKQCQLSSNKNKSCHIFFSDLHNLLFLTTLCKLLFIVMVSLNKHH